MRTTWRLSAESIACMLGFEELLDRFNGIGIDFDGIFDIIINGKV